MKFACDECAAQYMIADEKVGSKGVKVKCKKCSHVIVVRPQVETDPGEQEREESQTQMGAPPQEPETSGTEAPGEESGSEELAATDDGVDATIVMPNPMSEASPAPEAPAPAEGLGAPVPMAAKAPDLGGAGLEESGAGSTGLDDGLEQALGAELGAALGDDIAPPPTNGSASPSAAAAPAPESSEPAAAAAEAPVARPAAGPPGPDDEIGMAFDSIFGSGPGPETDPGGPPADPFSSDVDDAFEAALGSELNQELEDEHASTRVFDTQSMQVLAGERELQSDTEEEEQAFETGNGAAPEDSGDAEWYVAVDEEQVGPLTASEVQMRWEAGDISPDSLCWKNGMGDWEPLSTVEGLKDLIAPMPDAFVPEPAHTPEPEAEASVEAEIPGDDPDGGWKPGAAALLATLAADEMDALENEPEETLAAPTLDPVGLPAPAPAAPLGASAMGGLDLGSLPPPPAAPLDEGLPPAGAFQPEPATRPPPAYGTPSGGIPALGAAPTTGQMPAMGHPHHTTGAVHTLPVGPATGAVSTLGANPGGMQLTMGRLAALGGGLVAALTLIIFGGLWAGGVFDKESAVADPVPPVAPAPDPVAAATPAAAPAPAAAATPTPAPAATPAAAPAATPSPAIAKAPAAATAPSRPKARTRTQPKARTRTRTPEPKRPDPKPAAQPRGGGDDLLGGDDFDDIFDDKPKRGGNSGSSGPSRGYIPPAPGAGKNLPKALGQSDILKVVANNKKKLKNCADKQKAAAPGEKGRFVMNWRIRPDGSPASVSCKSKGAPVFCKCMKGAIGSMKFPRYGGPPMAAFDFPFSY